MDKNKNIQKGLSVFTLLVLVIAFQSCYKDEGNYSYIDINEAYVDTIGAKMNYVIEQFDTLSIQPEIRFTGKELDESKLTYRWMMYSDEWSKDEVDMVELSTERNLNVSINLEPNDVDYAVVLYITNTENNTVSQVKYNVSILKSVVSGWLVLHTNGNGESDMDYIATTNAVPTLDTLKWLHNVYSNMNDRKILGEPSFISSITDNDLGFARIYISTDQELLLLNGKDFELQYQDYDLFKATPETLLPQYIGHGPSCNYVSLLINNGKAHNINNQASQAWDVQFSRSLSPSGSLEASLTQEMKLFPQVYFVDDCSALAVGAAAVMYDMVNQRFVRLSFSFWEDAEIIAFPEQTTDKFDVNNIGKDLIYFGKGYNGHGFSVFTDGSSRELYRTNFNKASLIYNSDGTTTENEGVYSLAVNIYDLSVLPEIYEAKYYACGPMGNFFLYASEKNIYTYSYASSNKVATQINDAFPEDEVITGMKIYDTGRFSPLSDVRATLLYVSTWNGTEGKLYEFKINRASGRLNNKEEIDGVVNTNAPTHVFTGFGKIVDMCVKIEGTFE